MSSITAILLPTFVAAASASNLTISSYYSKWDKFEDSDDCDNRQQMVHKEGWINDTPPSPFERLNLRGGSNDDCAQAETEQARQWQAAAIWFKQGKSLKEIKQRIYEQIVAFESLGDPKGTYRNGPNPLNSHNVGEANHLIMGAWSRECLQAWKAAQKELETLQEGLGTRGMTAFAIAKALGLTSQTREGYEQDTFIDGPEADAWEESTLAWEKLAEELGAPLAGTTRLTTTSRRPLTGKGWLKPTCPPGKRGWLKAKQHVDSPDLGIDLVSDAQVLVFAKYTLDVISIPAAALIGLLVGLFVGCGITCPLFESDRGALVACS